MANDAPLQSSISCHAWNKAGDEVAISPNTRDVFIYSVSKDRMKWKKVTELEGHQMRVTGIDWSHSTGKIATSSQDRNAYVWTEQNKNEWKPTLVVLRIGRAATCIKWSPNGKKFAVGSGSKQIPICHYEESQDMWVAKMIKKAGKSSILSIDWSADSNLIIAGCADFKCRIFSAFIKGVDTDGNNKYLSDDVKDQAAVKKDGKALFEFDTKGWIESCCFSPSGNLFAFTGHDSTVHFGALEELKGLKNAKKTVTATDKLQTIKRKQLPLRAIAFLDDEYAIGAGYDCVPVLYKKDKGKWIEVRAIDTGKGKQQKKAKKSAFENSRNLFQNASKFGGADKAADAQLPYRHQNMINDIQLYNDEYFTTSSVDGRVLFWLQKDAKENKY